jgi:hypothetical protein
MTEDFYNIPKPQLPTQSPQVQTPQARGQGAGRTVDAALAFDITSLLSTLNTFALAWTMFYSAVQITHFFYSWVKYNDNEVSNLKTGAKYLINSFKIWASYLLTLGFFVLYIFTKSTIFGPFVGIIALFVYFMKFFGIDLGLIPVFDEYAAQVSKILAIPGEAIQKAITSAISPPKPVVPDKDKSKGKK